MKFYLVGGYVRDKVLRELGFELVHISRDRDHVVVGGSVDEMLAQGFVQVGASFPVFLHPETREEYALARREVTTGDKHTDFNFDFSPDISLEEDAQRRDFSINALYYDESSNELLDPTGQGLQDCKDGILRHAGIGFCEDPLRVLRCARLAAQLGFKVAPETVQLIRDMVGDGMLEYLSRERIDNEFMRALSPAYDSAKFLSYLHEWGALKQLYPELERLVDCKENPHYHWTGTTWGHTLAALNVARNRSARIKTALCYHDIYKPIAFEQKQELEHYVAHDSEDALDYLRKYLSGRKFDSRTKTLCKLAVSYHMRMRLLFSGMSVGKWVDMIASISSNFRADYLWQLEDFLEVCKADDLSDKTEACFENCGGRERWRIISDCALQTFEVCTQIQARDIPSYQDLEVEELKSRLRQARITAVKQQVDFFKKN